MITRKNVQNLAAAAVFTLAAGAFDGVAPARAADMSMAPSRGAGAGVAVGIQPAACIRAEYHCAMARVHCSGSYLGVNRTCLYHMRMCRELSAKCRS